MMADGAFQKCCYRRHAMMYLSLAFWIARLAPTGGSRGALTTEAGLVVACHEALCSRDAS